MMEEKKSGKKKSKNFQILMASWILLLTKNIKVALTTCYGGQKMYMSDY